MNLQRGAFLFVTTLAVVVATSAFGQTPAPIPDFSGIWLHPMLGFENPASGPGPVRNLSRTPAGASNFSLVVGDHNNPILQPWAAEVVRKRGEISRSGKAFPDPDNLCLLQPVPYIFWNFEIQMLQLRDRVVILYPHDQDFRIVRLNQSHPEKVTPTAHGDSVGHYEGDTLVIDTVGIKVGKYTMIDRFGTPYTEALHVVERYRLLDYAAAKEAQDRGHKEWPRAGGGGEPVAKDKGVQLEFTVEDKGAFTMPWKGIITYLRAGHTEWEERVCAENVGHDYVGNYYSDKDARLPTAEKPDF
jgi:hypothetical protein